MATMIFGMLASLDGYITGPEGGPQLPVPEAPLHRYFNQLMQDTKTAVYGCKLYEVMRYWDTDQPDWPDEAREFAAAWRDTPKLVCSSTLLEVGPNATLVGKDIVGTLKSLKTETDGLIDVGGAEFAASLAGQGLIDEYHLYLHAAVLGGGKSFFAGTTPKLRFLGQQILPQDVVLLRYAAA